MQEKHKKAMQIGLQVLGVLLLIPLVTLATLRFENRSADGPSILFPGGEMTSGTLHSGPEPDWGFTQDIQTVELQLNDPMASRLIYILESEGRPYVISGYMSTWLGRIWKEWAVEADQGNNEGVLRVNGVRYPRKLVRVEQGDALDGVARNLLQKYSGMPNPPPEAIAAARGSIESGNSWVFELQPL